MPRIPFIGAGGGRIEHYSIAAAEAWKFGALVLLDASEDLIEAGADPAAILGISLAEVAAGDLAGKLAGLGLKCPVLLAEADTLFWGDGDNAPVKGDINQVYGVAVDADGIWHVDGADTTNTRVEVVQVDLERNRYKFKILEANRQIP